MTKQKSGRHNVQRTCNLCGETFFARQDQVNCGRGVFCSDECSRKAKRQPRVDRACERCGKAFTAKQADIDKGKGRFCSTKCFHESPARPKVQRTCKWCGTGFLAHQCNIDKGGGIYCGHECARKSSRTSRVQRSCKQCGNAFTAKQDRVDRGKGIFCSPECFTESQKLPLPVLVCQCCGKVFTDRHRNNRKYCSSQCYQNARPKAVKMPARPHGHEKWALAVILRDKKCVRCGAIENLQAHHIESWRSHPELRYDTENGAALCPLCHHAQHPYLPLERFVASGGKLVKYCVVCEKAFLVKRTTQRTCSKKCGWKRKQMASAMQRRPA